MIATAGMNGYIDVPSFSCGGELAVLEDLVAIRPHFHRPGERTWQHYDDVTQLVVVADQHLNSASFAFDRKVTLSRGHILLIGESDSKKSVAYFLTPVDMYHPASMALVAHRVMSMAANRRVLYDGHLWSRSPELDGSSGKKKGWWNPLKPSMVQSISAYRRRITHDRPEYMFLIASSRPFDLCYVRYVGFQVLMGEASFWVRGARRPES